MENNHSCMIYTADQWKSTSNIGRIIPLGTLCIELFNDYSIKLKIGNGKLTFQYLPYIPDMSMYYSKTEIDGFNKIINDKINEIKDSLTYIDSRVTNLEGVAHTHDNKDILDKIEKPFTTSDKEKLDSLEPYDDSEIKNDIVYLKERSHTHDNKEILDKTTASFTTEYEWIITHGVTYDVFKPATSKEDGDVGLVPAPKKGDQNKFLRGDGTWTKVDPGETLNPATATRLGGVKIGNGINVTADGTISVDEHTIPIATTTTLGGVIVGDGLSIDNTGVLSANVQENGVLDVDINEEDETVLDIIYADRTKHIQLPNTDDIIHAGVANEVVEDSSGKTINVKYDVTRGIDVNNNNQLINTGLLDAYVENENLHLTREMPQYQSRFVTRTMDFQTNTSVLDTSKGTIEDLLPFTGRRRCNVSDDGTINAWYGDANYTEDGSNGQVMVYQPKFWYKTTPITLDGTKLRKASWSIAGEEVSGFKLHPAFYDEDGNEVDYILIGAFKGCLYDTSASTYDTTDSISYDYTVGTGDKLSSIADVKPVSGYNRSFTRANCKITAENRGAGWHPNNIRVASLNQMMMIVEYGGNMQTLVGRGVVDISGGYYNGSSITGSTYDIGNGTGRAALTYNSTIGTGSRTSYTENGKTSVCYRGMEDPWGNMWEFVDGINMYGAQPYIATDYNWSDSKNTGNYVSCGFTASSGYISAFGYNETFDWLFIGAESNGTDSNMIGDDQAAVTSSSYHIAYLGGWWANGVNAGAFYWNVADTASSSSRSLGARLTYVPQTNRS